MADLGQCLDAHAEFINEETMAVAYCDSAALIRADGRVLFKAHVPTGRLASHAWGSPDGRLVAVATTTKGGSAIALAFDMSSGPAPRRILVYDTKTGSIVDSLKFTWVYASAFSPDSSGFALVSGGILQMFHLPPAER